MRVGYDVQSFIFSIHWWQKLFLATQLVLLKASEVGMSCYIFWFKGQINA